MFKDWSDGEKSEATGLVIAGILIIGMLAIVVFV